MKTADSIVFTFLLIIIIIIFLLIFAGCGDIKLAEDKEAGEGNLCETVYYKDLDRDFFSDGVTSCEKRPGYYTKDELMGTEGDCDDSDPKVYPTPGSTPICDELKSDIIY